MFKFHSIGGTGHCVGGQGLGAHVGRYQRLEMGIELEMERMMKASRTPAA